MILFCTLYLLFAPALVIWIATKSKFVDKFGVITLTFSFGVFCAILLALITFYDVDTLFLHSSTWHDVQVNVLDTSIRLALPLIITSFNIKKALRSAKDILFAMMLSVISMMLVSFTLAMLFHTKITNMWQYASLAFSAYVGNGMNMAVINSAIGAEETVFITMTSYDIKLSVVYLLFMLSAAIPLVSKCLPVFSNSHAHVKLSKNKDVTDDINNKDQPQLVLASYDSALNYVRLVSIGMQKYNIISLVIAVVIVIISMSLASFFPINFQSTATMIIITTLSLTVSMMPTVNRLPTSYMLGSYLLMVFCFTIGSMLDIATFFSINFELLSFLVLLIFGGFSVHLYLCKFFKIDRDSFLVTSVASIMSLPFIPLIVSRLGNNHLLVAGLSVALIGDILGTYLGISLAYLLQWVLSA